VRVRGRGDRGRAGLTATGSATDNELVTTLHAAEDRSAVERLVFFSDAVFAIAITLLVLDLRVPDVLATAGDQGLLDALAALGPSIFAFLLSFTVIAAFWIGHFRTFRAVVRVDNRLVVLNLGFLGCVALLPFPTSIVAHHGDLPSAAIAYAVFQIVTSLLSTLTWAYPAQVAHLVPAAVTPEIARAVTYRALVVPLIFAISIPIALFVSPILAEAIWFMSFPAQALLTRHFGLHRTLELSAAPASPDGDAP
jgi:uncharacterized membrane protein